MTTTTAGAGPTTALRAVCWDMDGTLVGTEPYWLAGQRYLVEEHGGTWTDHLRAGVVGNNLPAMAELLRTEGGVTMPADDVIAFLLDYVARRSRERMPWQPGAVELLTALRARHVRLALVTMSYRATAQDVVDQLPAGVFDVVLTGEDVTHGKPDPEPYATAVARLEVDTDHALAIEDSVNGVRSATGAGLVTVCLTHDNAFTPSALRVPCASLEDVTAERLAGLVRAAGGAAAPAD